MGNENGTLMLVLNVRASVLYGLHARPRTGGLRQSVEGLPPFALYGKGTRRVRRFGLPLLALV